MYTTVGGLKGKREKHSGSGQSGVNARRYWPSSRKAAEGHSWMVRPGACTRFQLRELWPESNQRAFRRKVGLHSGLVQVGFRFLVGRNILSGSIALKSWIIKGCEITRRGIHVWREGSVCSQSLRVSKVQYLQRKDLQKSSKKKGCKRWRAGCVTTTFSI